MSATEIDSSTADLEQLHDMGILEPAGKCASAAVNAVLPVRETPRKRARLLTERRREQNRRAQKIHREKQKKQKGSVTQEVLSTQNVASPQPGFAINLENDGDTFALSQDFTPGIDLPNVFLEYPKQASHDWTGSLIPDVEEQYNIFSTAHNPQVWNNSLDVPTPPLSSSYEKPDWSSYVSNGNVNLTHHSLQSSGTFEQPTPNNWTDLNTYSYIPDDQTLTQPVARQKEIHDITRLLLDQNITYEDVILAGIEALSQKSSTTPNSASIEEHGNSNFNPPTSYMPSLFKTHIPFRQIGLIKACLANAVHIGARVGTRTMCDQNDTSSSPFFSGTPENINTTFEALKPDLQPCVAQMTQPHPLYIDVLPLPYFRKRVLALRACKVDEDGEEVLDEADLTRDIDSGGVICWGADSGIGSGTPWDSRSWECAAWFLKKWWMVTGGVKGEIGKQSRWWAESRGEVFDET